MIFAAVVAIGLAWLIGLLAVGALWPRTRPLFADAGLVLSLGLGVGLGMTATIFFAVSLAVSGPWRAAVGLELLIGIGLGWYCWRRRRQPAAFAPEAMEKRSWCVAVATLIFVQAGIVATVIAWRAYAAEPYGGWDGWAIWNLHARLIFRGGVDWTHYLELPQIAWTHPDYPLLLPASVARAWAFAGQDAPSISGLISALFGVATVALIVAAVTRLRQRLIALLGGLMLLSTPFFVTFASNQHADVPLGFFMLATVVLMASSLRSPEARGIPALAGLCAGLAAWTKNEGLFFAVVAGIGWSSFSFQRGSRRMAGAFFSGLGFALLPVACFKGFVAPPSDLVSEGLGARLDQLVDGSRHRLIASSLWRDLTRFGEWRVVPFLAMALPLMVPGGRRLHRREWTVAAVIGMMGAGYYAVYLLTPWDLAWHLDSSLVRLLLQLWPAAVFFWCLAVGADDTIPPAVDEPVVRRGTMRGVLVLANVVVAAAALTMFARQLAPNQLAVVRVNGGEASLTIGDGWFGREGDSGGQWMWSRGESTLFVHVSAMQPATVTLRFRVRGLGVRTAKAVIGDHVIWRGAVGEALTAVEVAGLVVPPGMTKIVFTTDAPGVPESAAPGARALTFALYDPGLRSVSGF